MKNLQYPNEGNGKPAEISEWPYTWQGHANLGRKLLEDPDFTGQFEVYKQEASQIAYQVVSHAISTSSHMPAGKSVLLAKIVDLPLFELTGVYDPKTDAQFNISFFWELLGNHIQEELKKQRVKNIEVYTNFDNAESRGSEITIIAKKSADTNPEPKAHPASSEGRGALHKLLNR